MSCVTGVTEKTGTTFYAQYTQLNLPKEFGHTAGKSQSESKTNQTAAASGHLQ